MKVKKRAAGWEAFYREGRSSSVEPDPNLLAHTDFFRRNHVSRVLDLGCGDGRHLIFLGKLGYEMYGLDFAPTALNHSKERLDREGLQVELKCGDMSQLPWPDQYFDAIVSIRVLHHNTIVSVRKALDEICRVLRPGGYVLATVAKAPPPRDWKEGHFARTGPQTYVPLKGHEKGLPHHFFTEPELRKLLSGFTIILLQEDAADERRYAFLAQKMR
jgi:ubiquinone/menaquinone biosynthesis C-methylase UbiE